MTSKIKILLLILYVILVITYRIAEARRIAVEQFDDIPITCEDYYHIKDYAKCKVIEEWDESQWVYFEDLIQEESSWRPDAVNPISGACSLGQALPCSKIEGDWKDPHVSIPWTIAYVAERYGTPQEAMVFWHCIGMCHNPHWNVTTEKKDNWY